MNNFLNRNESEAFGTWIRSLNKIEYSELASQGKLLAEWEKINESYLSMIRNSKKRFLNLIFISGILLMIGGIFIKLIQNDIGNITVVLSGVVITYWAIKCYPYLMKYYTLSDNEI